MKATAYPTKTPPHRRFALTDTQLMTIAARLARGDKQADIARELNILPETVSRVCCKIRKHNADLVQFNGRDLRHKAIQDAATTQAPVDLSIPENRVWAFIKNNHSPHTQRSYFADLRQAAELMKVNSIDELLAVEIDDVMQYFESLKARKLANASINRKLSALFSLLDREIRLGFRQPPNPADPLFVKRMPPSPRSQLDTLTVNEVNRILETCEQGAGRRDVRDAAMLRVGFWHGLRVSELAGLTAAKPRDWTQRTNAGYFFKRDGSWFLHVVGKGEKSRMMPVGKEVIRAIGRNLKICNSNWDSEHPLWLATTGRKRADGLTTRAIRRILQSRCRLAGIRKNISSHSMRKTAATRLLDLGVDLERIRHFLGHSTLVVTQRYLSARDDLKTHAAHVMHYAVSADNSSNKQRSQRKGNKR